MLDFVQRYATNTYSQNGEDGIIAECLRRINPELKYAVEFGGADGYYCSNTALLREKGWAVNMYDLNPGSSLVMRAHITEENVNQVVRPCSVLSIDIDGNDYNVWASYSGKPDIVIIEINSSYPAMSAIPISDTKDGTSYLPMVLLGQRKGYFLLCHTGNCIFILNEHKHLFPEITGSPIIDHEKYFNISWLKQH